MAFIPDLEVLRGSSSSWYRITDPAPVWFDYGPIPSDVTVYAVGWLGDTVDSRGSTPEPCIGRLLQAYEAGHRFSDGTMGSHTCELCPRSTPPRGYHHPFTWNGRTTTLYGHGHHLVLHGESLFICPALILHYIVDHQYRPPAVFLEAVLRGKILIPGEESDDSPFKSQWPSGTCENCDQPAQYRRDGRRLCGACYQALVPSWARRPADSLDGIMEVGPGAAAADLTHIKRVGQLASLGRYLALSVLFGVLLSVATVQAALSSEWGDAVVTSLPALALTVYALRLWRRMRAPPA